MVPRGSLAPTHLPTSFLPDEDQGYLFVNMQLPNLASLERASAAARQVEKILADTPGVQYTTRVIGFSLLSYVRTTYNANFFVSLEPWCDRKSQARTISSHQGTFEPGTQASAGRWHLGSHGTTQPGPRVQELAPREPRSSATLPESFFLIALTKGLRLTRQES